MRFLVLLSVLFLVTSINAAPIKLSVPEDTDLAGNELDQGTVPGDTQEDAQNGQDEKENGKNDNVNKSNGTSFQFFSTFGDLDKTASSMEKVESVFRDLERRIVGDLVRIGKDLSLMQGLPDTPSNSTQSSAEVPEDGGHDSNLLGWPIFGSILPLFHSFLENMKPKGTNTTYEVHVTNGTRVEVNKTISKDSGEGYNSFFQHEVIRVRPDKEPKDQVAVRKDLGETTSPQLKEESGDGEQEEDQKRDKSMEEPVGSEEPEEEENEVE